MLAVLIHNVEPVQDPQSGITSLIWVDTVDAFFSTLSNSWYSSFKSGVVLRGGITNWKFSLTNGSSAHSLHHLANQMVKRASQAMESITKDESKLNRNLRSAQDIIRSCANFRITLNPKWMRIGLVRLESIEYPLEILDVYVGPIEFAEHFVVGVRHFR